jgi:hypothetical protein
MTGKILVHLAAHGVSPVCIEDDFISGEALAELGETAEGSSDHVALSVECDRKVADSSRENIVELSHVGIG